MSSEALPRPEPAEIDETLSMELRHLPTNAGSRGRPSADERCTNGRYYPETTADVSYCWNPKLRILVGDSWSCQRWEPTSVDSLPTSACGAGLQCP